MKSESATRIAVVEHHEVQAETILVVSLCLALAGHTLPTQVTGETFEHRVCSGLAGFLLVVLE